MTATLPDTDIESLYELDLPCELHRPGNKRCTVQVRYRHRPPCGCEAKNTCEGAREYYLKLDPNAVIVCSKDKQGRPVSLYIASFMRI